MSVWRYFKTLVFLWVKGGDILIQNHCVDVLVWWRYLYFLDRQHSVVGTDTHVPFEVACVSVSNSKLPQSRTRCPAKTILGRERWEVNGCCMLLHRELIGCLFLKHIFLNCYTCILLKHNIFTNCLSALVWLKFKDNVPVLGKMHSR